MVWQNTANKPLYYNSTFVQGGTSPSHQTLAFININQTLNKMKEYFALDKNNKVVLISNGIEYEITVARIDGVDYFYQYPTIEEMERGQTQPKKRLVSEINNSLPK